MTRPRYDGPTKGHLERLITRYSQEQDITADRVRRWVSTMVLLGALERSGQDGGPQFVLKGGVAIELRLRTAARATQDVDVIFGGPRSELLAALDEAFSEQYCEFLFERGDPEGLGPHATRFDVRLTYQTRAWATVRLEISDSEVSSDDVDVERISAISLEDFKLSGPDEVVCLPLRFQIAQKLHAVTEQPDRRDNVRFRDLVDLLILRDLVDDLIALRRACEETFAQRATHSWPPDLTVPDSWRDGYARLADSVGLEITDVDGAANEVRAFITEIASAR